MEIAKTIEQAIEIITQVMGTLESQAFEQEGFSDLSMRQLLYLETIARLGNPTFSELADALGVTKPSVTVIVQKLIRMNYVGKIQSEEDRRVYHIILDERGKQFTQIHRDIHKFITQRLMARLDENEVLVLADLLKKVTHE